VLFTEPPLPALSAHQSPFVTLFLGLCSVSMFVYMASGVRPEVTEAHGSLLPAKEGVSF